MQWRHLTLPSPGGHRRRSGRSGLGEKAETDRAAGVPGSQRWVRGVNAQVNHPTAGVSGPHWAMAKLRISEIIFLFFF